MRRVALVGAFNKDGHLLLGIRNDNGRWTLPGGHLEEGEDPREGAVRELFEETTLEPGGELSLVEHKKLDHIELWFYRTNGVSGKPSSENDPDNECSTWHWIDVSEGVPKDIANNIQGGKNLDDNLLLSAFGLKKSEYTWAEHRFTKLSKASLFAQTAYRHKTTGQIFPSGPIHDYGTAFEGNQDPELYQLATEGANLDEYGLVKDPVVEPGFLDHAGEFHTRKEASVLAFGSQRTTGGDSDVFRESGHMKKREEHDEVDRMLVHADPAERRMALKLGTVREPHLIRALHDDDPELQRAAFEHPAFGHGALTALMRHPSREHLQLLGLDHDKADTTHVHTLYDHNKNNKKLVDAITRRSDLDGPFINKMYEEGNGSRALIANLHTPPETIKNIIEKHFLPGHDQKSGHRYLVMEALKHPHALPELVDKAIKEGDEGIKLAAAASPHLSSAAADDILKRGQLPANHGEAFLRYALAASPHASEAQLTQALEDTHPRVRTAVFNTASPNLNEKHVERAIEKGDPHLIMHALRSKAAKPEHQQRLATDKRPEVRELSGQHQTEMKKYEGELGAWLAFKGLQKAVEPKQFAGIVRASDPAGRVLVNHKPHLDSHPPEHQHLVNAYREHVLNSPQKVSRLSKKTALPGEQGITKKQIYEIPHHVQSVGGQKFMVKPYHERIIRPLQKLGKNPHQGWAEMAHQGLYHAAGIGGLHQKVHVSEHNMGNDLPNEPALVIAMEKNHTPVYKMGYGSVIAADKNPALKEQSRKIAMMDFLTNNLDRHGANLMMNGESPALGGTPTKMLAIDHSRSFQYSKSHQYKWKKEKEMPPEINDDFQSYAGGRTSIGDVAPLLDQKIYDRYDRQMQSLHDYAPVFDWWGEVSPKVKAEMAKHLEQIQDPNVRAHIKRNFDARAAWLDERANIGLENYGNEWYNDSVPMYRPGQISDDERQERYYESLRNPHGQGTEEPLLPTGRFDARRADIRGRP